jgi:hypothetical protein
MSKKSHSTNFSNVWKKFIRTIENWQKQKKTVPNTKTCVQMWQNVFSYWKKVFLKKIAIFFFEKKKLMKKILFYFLKSSNS